jgi:hypothetical protein
MMNGIECDISKYMFKFGGLGGSLS